MSIFGSVPTFDYKSDEWQVHVALLNNFFVANGINATTDAEGSRRRAILLNCMSQDSYRLVRDLLHPLTPEATTYNAILDTLKSHFQPKKCLFAERENFYSAKKESHETLSDFAARLRGLASGCSFGTSLDMCLSDRFVLGLDSAVIREKLFREDPTELKLSKALEIAIAVEGAQRVVRGAGRELAPPVLYAGGARAPRRQQRAATATATDRCLVCGGKSHSASDCGYRHCLNKLLNCDNCGQKGHLKRVCKNKNRKGDGKNVHQNNFISDGGSENSEDACDRDCLLVNNIKCSDGAPMVVEVRVGDVTLGMEVDSGSAVSALPEAVWRRYFSRAALGKLGEFNKYKLSLQLKDDSVPKFRRARSVPFAIRDKVSAELDRLVSAGILKPVSYSKYASPIVAVLHGCCYYTKLDLSNSYNQFVLDDGSQQYTCINTHKGLFVYMSQPFG